jgi:hypothetical protein
MPVPTPPSADYRIDHRGYVPEIWVGLLLTALYLAQADRVIPSISDSLELALDLMLAIGCLLCLVGAALGTRWCFPRVGRSVSYGLEVLGLPLIIISLAWFTYAATDSQNTSSLLLAALGGGLGLCIEIASVRMFVDLVTGIRELP